MAEYGIVKFFSRDRQKQFGFLQVLNDQGEPTGEELHFRYVDGFFFREGPKTPEFRYRTGSACGGTEPKHILKPKQGDKLVFVRGRSSRGERVKQWGHASQYDAFVARIASRPTYQAPTYRVVKTGSNYGADSSGVVWQGKDTVVLSAMRPKRERFGRIIDDLGAGSADSGDMHWSFRFEVQQPDGSWTSCNDPRVLLCCVPKHIYRQHGQPHILPQGNCRHGNRR